MTPDRWRLEDELHHKNSGQCSRKGALSADLYFFMRRSASKALDPLLDSLLDAEIVHHRHTACHIRIALE